MGFLYLRRYQTLCLYQLQLFIADFAVGNRLPDYPFFGDDGGDVFIRRDIKGGIGRADIAGRDGDAFDVGYFYLAALFNGYAVARTQ